MPRCHDSLGSRTANGKDDASSIGMSDAPASSVRVEFAVNINQSNDLEKIKHQLAQQGIKLAASDFESKTIQLDLGNETNSELRNVQNLQNYIEKDLGFVTVLKGLGTLCTAVAELRPSKEVAQRGGRIFGVVRLSQMTDNQCRVDGLVDNLIEKGESLDFEHSLAIHEFGDLSADNLDSVGKSLHHIHTQSANNRLSVVKVIPDCQVSALIGRSVALSEHDPGRKRVKMLSAGVIARAATIETNDKRFCTCSGKTLWEERSSPSPL